MRSLIDFLVTQFGYLNVIHMKDGILFIAGIIFGMVIMTTLVSVFFHRLHNVDVDEKVIALTIKCKGDPIYFAKPSSFCESVQIVLYLSIVALFKKNIYKIKNTTWTNLIFYTVLFSAIGMILIGYLFINHTILPPDTINSLYIK